MKTCSSIHLTDSKLAILLLFVLVSFSFTLAQDWDRIINLKGTWKFSLGDDKQWAAKDFKDSEWEDIKVPAAWETEGYYNYNGFAWYRIHFNYDPDLQNENIYVDMGYIDDVDEVYLNGKLIGSSGSFWPDYKTAASVRRRYPVESKMFVNGDNVIAVRVFDSYSTGGILKGDVGVYTLKNALLADINLEGKWLFKKGDDESWKDLKLDVSDWQTIQVPGVWDKNYDGFAWYRKEFRVEKDFNTDKLILMVGKIDDLDEVYVNGNFVGATGFINKDKTNIKIGGEAADFRCYLLPKNLLKKGEINIIAVRVYDGRERGGIYEGPVGIIHQDKYRKYWKEKGRNVFDSLFGSHF
ncbi:MAG: hypothetical protein ACM3MI_16180 [Clostridiales bacterium]